MKGPRCSKLDLELDQDTARLNAHLARITRYKVGIKHPKCLYPAAIDAHVRYLQIQLAREISLANDTLAEIVQRRPG